MTKTFMRLLKILGVILFTIPSVTHAQEGYAGMYGTPNPDRSGSFIASNPSGSNAFVSNSGARWCFDTTCTYRFALLSTDQLISSGITLFQVGTLNVAILNAAPFSQTLQLNGGAADGVSAVGVAVNTSSAYVNGTARLLSVRNNTVEKMFVGVDGFTQAPYFSAAAGLFTSSAGSNLSATLQGTKADSISAVGTILDNNVALVTAGSKLLSIRNNGVEKTYIDKDGSIFLAATATNKIDWGAGSAAITASGNVFNMSIGAGVQANQYANSNTAAPNTLISNTVNSGTVAANVIDTNVTQNIAGGRLLSIRNNTVQKYAFDLNGKPLTTTTDTSGTPGSGTANTNCGRSAVASGASTATITNSNVAATSNVWIQLETSAAGIGNIAVAPGSGSFVVTTINGTGAATNATANATFSWCVQN